MGCTKSRELVPAAIPRLGTTKPYFKHAGMAGGAQAPGTYLSGEQQIYPIVPPHDCQVPPPSKNPGSVLTSSNSMKASICGIGSIMYDADRRGGSGAKEITFRGCIINSRSARSGQSWPMIPLEQCSSFFLSTLHSFSIRYNLQPGSYPSRSCSCIL